MNLKAFHVLYNKLPDKMMGPLAVALGVFYIAFHVVSGEHGIYALLRDQRQLEILKAELNDVRAQNKKLEHDVRLMSSSSLDLDMLDEQSRRILDNAGENELVIPLRK